MRGVDARRSTPLNSRNSSVALVLGSVAAALRSYSRTGPLLGADVFTGWNAQRHYYITMFGAAGEGTPARVAAVGRSIDELVRVNGQWLIKLRNVAPLD